ncbi:MAG TPA: hypothetical protein DDW52_16615 [Planctomycetaceae bacterium]|nr:hypothetical protein [Planctomycetaceae bacterium]
MGVVADEASNPGSQALSQYRLPEVFAPAVFAPAVIAPAVFDCSSTFDDRTSTLSTEAKLLWQGGYQTLIENAATKVNSIRHPIIPLVSCPFEWPR